MFALIELFKFALSQNLFRATLIGFTFLLVVTESAFVVNWLMMVSLSALFGFVLDVGESRTILRLMQNREGRGVFLGILYSRVKRVVFLLLFISLGVVLVDYLSFYVLVNACLIGFFEVTLISEFNYQRSCNQSGKARLGKLIQGLLSVLFLPLAFLVWEGVGILFVPTICSAIAVMFLLVSNFKEMLETKSTSITPNETSYSRGVLLNDLLWWARSSGMPVLAAIILTTQDVIIVGLVTNISQVLLVFNSSLDSLLTKRIYDAYAKEERWYAQKLLYYWRAVLLGVGGVVLGIVVLAQIFYQGGVKPFPLLLMVGFFFVVFNLTFLKRLMYDQSVGFIVKLNSISLLIFLFGAGIAAFIKIDFLFYLFFLLANLFSFFILHRREKICD